MKRLSLIILFLTITNMYSDELACSKCKKAGEKFYTTTERVCPNCGATDLSTDWSGFIVLSTPEKSQVAKQLDITKPGKYAVKVS